MCLRSLARRGIQRPVKHTGFGLATRIHGHPAHWAWLGPPGSLRMQAAMVQPWRTDSGESSTYFDTSVHTVAERAKLWLRVNGTPEDGFDAAYRELTGPGCPFEMIEGYIKVDNSTTNAPHLRGPNGHGQKYRYFKNGPHSLPKLWQLSAQAFGGMDCMVYQGPEGSGVERFTFQEAYEAAEGLAAWLIQETGLQKGDRVAQLSRNTPEWMLSFMATTMAGGVSAAMNSLWVPAELEYGINDSGISVAFVDGERAARVLPLCRDGKLPKLKVLVIGRDPKGIAAQGGGPVRVLALADVLAAAQGRKLPPVEVLPEDNAYLMYTSGTTGFPKGVLSTHRALMNAWRSCILNFAIAAKVADPDTPPVPEPMACLCPMPLFHISALLGTTILSFGIGRKTVFMHKWDALEALKLIESEKITDLTGVVPTMALDLLSHPAFSKYDTTSLKNVGTGGAAAPARLPQDATRKSMRSFQSWGLTEINGFGTMNYSPEDYVQNPSSCGRAFPLCDIKVVNEQNQEVPPGSPGEILVRTVQVMKEYWNKPEATAKAISADGWFRSGDIGRLEPDGALYIMDRAKELIIRGGENISCAEVESALYQHPSVKECAVLGMPDERLGEIVTAAIVPAEGSAPFTAEEMMDFLAPRLAKFKIPSELFLWKKGELLPRGATEKIHKKSIKQEIIDHTANCYRLTPGSETNLKHQAV